ncbi:MAG: transposase [Anaerolineae bacterium]|nr:transposase [Anaerolineae bacterium]
MEKKQQPSDWLEARRLRAWELHQRGWSQRRIATELGVTQGAVSHWLKRVRKGGVNGLQSRPTGGRRAALTDEQFGQLPTMLQQGARAFGFEDNKWTTSRIAVVLKRSFGVAYHPAHISRLLKKHYPEWRDQKKD